jgi:hypothetical protein
MRTKKEGRQRGFKRWVGDVKKKKKVNAQLGRIRSLFDWASHQHFTSLNLLYLLPEPALNPLVQLTGRGVGTGVDGSVAGGAKWKREMCKRSG